MLQKESRQDRLRRVLWRTTLPHTCIGHPIAAVLSRVGFRGLAEAVHYHTLPARIKAKRPRNSLAFNHDPRLFWADAFWGVGASICRAMGWDRMAAFLFYRGPVAAVRELGAMDYAPLPLTRCAGCAARRGCPIYGGGAPQG